MSKGLEKSKTVKGSSTQVLLYVGDEGDEGYRARRAHRVINDNQLRSHSVIPLRRLCKEGCAVEGKVACHRSPVGLQLEYPILRRKPEELSEPLLELCRPGWWLIDTFQMCYSLQEC